MNASVGRRLRWAANVMGPLLLLAAWLRGDGGWGLLAAGAIAMAGGEYLFRFRDGRWPTPYMAMALAPLLLVHYSSVADFRIRLACFFVLIYVTAAANSRLRRRLPAALSDQRRLGPLCLAVFALAALVFYARNIHLSGDEPHYVMIAQSLVEDGDFDLRNNIENRTYFSYLPVEVRFHGSVRAGRFHSFHLPGMSFLLLPFYLLFKLLGGLVPANLYFRLAAALINSVFALGLFQVLRSLWPDEDNGAAFLFFLATFPLVFHAVHLYPELPAATLLLFAFLAGRRQRPRLLLVGSLLAAIPWLHFKYLVPMLILDLAVAAAIVCDSAGWRQRIGRLARLLAPQAASAALLALYSRALYGSFNPLVISPEKNIFAIPLVPKLETLLSFFLDQRDGLLVYAPLFLLLFLAFRKEVRARVRDFWLLSAMLISYVLFHAFTTVRGAYSPAARPTVFVLWIMAVYLVAYYRQAGEFAKALFRFLAGLTAFASLCVFYYPLFLYQPVTRDVSERGSSLLYFLGSRAIDLTSVFPSFLKKPNNGYLPNRLWLTTLGLGLLFYYVRWPKPANARLARVLFPVLGLLLLFFVCFVPHVQLQTRYSAAGLSFYCNSRNFNPADHPGGFKAKAGQDYDLFIDLAGSSAAGADLRLHNPRQVPLRIMNGRRTLGSRNREPERRIALPLRSLSSFALGKRKLIHLGLETPLGQGDAFLWLEFSR